MTDFRFELGRMSPWSQGGAGRDLIDKRVTLPVASPPCPGLLVSVRDAVEAQTAVECGVNLIDIKEPRNGPLGAATAEVVTSIAEAVGDARPISVALGELVDHGSRVDRYGSHLGSIEFAKIGLANAGGIDRWWVDWEQAWASLPRHLSRVGVVYADWQEARSPSPLSAIRVFADGGCRAILFDTFRKDSRSLLDHAAGDCLAKWTDAARMAAPLLVLAGSITAARLESVRPYAPDYVAVRGAACDEGRLSRISAVRLRSFANALDCAFDPTARR